MDDRNAVDNPTRAPVADGGDQRPRLRGRRVPPMTALPPDQRAAIGAAARTIAERLHETGPKQREARILIFRIVRWCGEERALAWVTEAERLERAGGELVASGQRRRTFGGIFFQLAKRDMSARQRSLVWPPRDDRVATSSPAESQRAAMGQTGAPHAAPTTLDTSERLLLATTLQARTGRASSVKVSLVGRPDTITERGAFIAFTWLPPEQAPALPRGVPLPPHPPTGAFLVYVAQKQWRRVVTALDDPEDVLIVEGFGLPSADLPATVEVYTMNITTKKIQAAKRAPSAERASE